MGEDHMSDAVNYILNSFHQRDALREKEAYDFEQLFHIGVKFRQVNSKLEWIVIEVKEDDNGKWARIRSPKGYHKWINSGFYRSYEPSYMPEAVKVLYGK